VYFKDLEDKIWA